MKHKGVPLSDAIADLRRQLHDGITAAEGDELKLAVDSLEVEFTVEASMDGGGDASGGFWSVVSAKGFFGFRRARTHRVLLRLNPEWEEELPDGTAQRKPVDLRNKRPLSPEQ